jgi:hypothetical protein
VYQPTDELPSFFRRVETEFEESIKLQSYGKLIIDVKTIQRSGGDSLKPWETGKTPCYWRTAWEDPQLKAHYGCDNGCAISAEGCVHRLVLDQISADLGSSYFSNENFDWVSFIHMGEDFSSSFAGWSGHLGFNCQGNCSGPDYCGLGTLQRPVMGAGQNGDEGSVKWMLAHELGHSFGLDHTPRASADGAGERVVKMGRYSVMQLGTPTPIDFVNHSYVPYHLWEIAERGGEGPLKWFADSDFVNISSDALDVAVYDVRLEDDHNAVIVDTKDNSYDSEFWIVHHQDEDDTKVFGGDRLAIWHMRNPDLIGSPTDFDLEVATGKREDCGSSLEDANSGVDSLECGPTNDGHRGSLFDLWPHGAGPESGGVAFTPDTNPNTNDYASNAYPGTQSEFTNICIDNMRFPYPHLPYTQPYLVDIDYNCIPPPGSSPFLYLWGGFGFPIHINVLAGLGQSENPRGEYIVGSDFLVLDAPRPFDDHRYSPFEDDRYVFKIREEGRSTTYIDQVEVRVVDHDPTVRIAATRTGGIVGYSEAVPADVVLGLPGDPRMSLSRRGDPIHGAVGDTLVLQWLDLGAPLGEGGVILSSSGRESNEMPQVGGLVVERQNGQGGWEEIARVPPRSTFTDLYLDDGELGRDEERMSLRVRWTDYHALDYAAFVRKAESSSWSWHTVSLDSAGIEYAGPRLEELARIDGSFAVLSPREKLTVVYPYEEVEAGRNRTVIFGTTGYYVEPTEHEGRVGGVVSDSGSKVIRFLDRTHPNPFNPSTSISFGLNRGSHVSLSIYSAEGELVRGLYEGALESGEHEFVWDGRTGDGRTISSGVYFYRLQAGSEQAAGRMVMLK